MPETPAHSLEQLAISGICGGLAFRHRGTEIRSFPAARVCSLVMPDHLLDSQTYGAPETDMNAVDSWLYDGQMPAYNPPAQRA